VKGVLAGKRLALAKTITLLEGKRPDQRRAAEGALGQLLPKSGKALRIGISGTPGVGKSTFIEALGKILLSQGHRLAVLAVDPSSPLSGGSILGDRVRMEELSKDERVFIRPSPTSGTLGGVARHTREVIIACEAGGHDIVLVETVGVGQSEMEAASMVDVFLILSLPNSGDEIQGLKKGILELADIVAVTKSDGGNLPFAKVAKEHLERSLMVARGPTGWLPPVLLVSSTEGTGLAELWTTIQDFVAQQRAAGAFDVRRARQSVAWFHAEMGELLRERLRERPGLAGVIDAAEHDVESGKVVASLAAAQVIDRILK
jgi:LAO/AO transport system kinase